jgi:hypothetical protein
VHAESTVAGERQVTIRNLRNQTGPSVQPIEVELAHLFVYKNYLRKLLYSEPNVADLST